MSRINTNVASLRGLRNYNKANKLLDSSLTRLSTGLQINSGKDNPSGLIASETLRLQVTSIEQSIKNSNRANNVIATADGALGEISGLLNQVRGLVQEGLNDGALSQSEKEANQLQIDAALGAINRISSNTSFAGDKLIDGSKSFTTKISATDSAKLNDLQVNEAILGTNDSIALNATVTQAAEQGQLAYFGGALTEKATIEVGGSKGTEVIFLGDSASSTDIAAAINGVSDSTGVSAAVRDGLKLGSAEGVKSTLSSTVGTATAAEFTFTAVDGAASTTTFTAAAATDAITAAVASDGTDTFTVAADGNLAGAAGNGFTFEIVDTGVGGASANFDAGTGALVVDLGGATLSVTALETLVEGAGPTGSAGDFAVTITGAAGDDAQVTAQTGSTGGNDLETVDFTAVAEGVAGDAIDISVNTGQATTSVSVTGNAVTFNLATGASVADLAAILDDPQTADEVAAANLLSASYSGGGATAPSTVAVTGTATNTNLAGGADAEEVTFTADTAGAAGNEVEIIVNRGATSNSVSTNGSEVTFNLTNAATVADLVGLLDTPATTGETAAAALVDISYAGTGPAPATAIANTVSATNLTSGADAPEFTFTADTAGAAGNNVQVQFAAATTPSADLSVAVTGAGTEADPSVITFTLGTDATGAVNSTIADVQALLENAPGGSAAETAAGLVDLTPNEGTSASTVISATTLNTATNLANGTDVTTTLTFLDQRADGSTGTISVALAVGTGDELSATVGAADAEGNQTITFNLVDDVDGNITSTVEDLKNLISSDSTLSGLVSADGTAEGNLFAQGAQELQGGDDATVVLSSKNFGSNEVVNLTVLDGSLETFDTTGVVSSSDTGTDIGVTINGQDASANGLAATIRTGTLDATLTFNASDNSVNQTVSLEITGGGSLFQIGQEVSPAGQIGIGVQAINTARLGGISGKLFELGTGNGKSLLDVGENGVSGSDLVGIIDQSLEKVSTLRGRLGAIQKNVIETNISTLGAALENISEARSQITDTDFAVETAALTKAQILQQSGISVLSIANQAPQQVLSLLG